MKSDSSNLISGLPDDLALLCFAYLPRRVHPLSSCVSRAWKHAFQSHALLSLRRKLGTLDTWLLLCLTGDNLDEIDDVYTTGYLDNYSWWVIDPALCPQCNAIAFPPTMNTYRIVNYEVLAAANDQGEVLLADYREPGDLIPLNEICRLDMFHKRWLRPSPPNMLTHRTRFASASLDGYVYVAGGEEMPKHGRDYSSAFKSAERLDCKTMASWESLPDMHVARTYAGGVVLNGCFYVIGGYVRGGNGKIDKVYSGEIWDPRSQNWNLVPELWPYHIFAECCGTEARNVAVVMRDLFAIKQVWKEKRELMRYDNANKVWTSLGCIPIESFIDDSKLAEIAINISSHGSDLANRLQCKPFGVGKELWVVVHGVHEYDLFMIACSPLSGQSVSWRRLPYSFQHSVLDGGIAVSV